ncbi:hypothetical protein FCV25MIE_14039, partial [Fagus crenata]
MVLEPVPLVIPQVWVVQGFPVDAVMALKPVELESLRAWRALGLSAASSMKRIGPSNIKEPSHRRRQ